MATCGEKLLYLRRRAGLTQKKVAEKLHLERSCYTYYELGRSNPSYRSLLQLSRLYGVSVEYLIDEEIPVWGDALARDAEDPAKGR